MVVAKKEALQFKDALNVEQPKNQEVSTGNTYLEAKLLQLEVAEKAKVEKIKELKDSEAGLRDLITWVKGRG